MPRPLLLQTHLTLSGHSSGPSSDLSWITTDWDDQMKAHIASLTSRVNHVLLGRKLAEGFIPTWLSRPESEDGVKQMNAASKTVFSRTLQAIPESWQGGGKVELFAPVESEEGDQEGEVEGKGLVEKVWELKGEGEGMVAAYGGGEVVSQLLHAGLVDEMLLLISPIAFAEGRRMFEETVEMKLIEAKGFQCGIVAARYKVKKSG
ncbi:Hypothetical protein D9617_1g082480 [Elsinoe fawcettii]|nr:Hypothetical protein D9617_1g082480 [Elsinoe fawcettii]